jgi:hypothetical protein
MLSPPTREQRSLFGEILDWMLAPLLLLWPISMALTWLMAQGIANQPYDRELGTLARTLARRISVEATPQSPGGVVQLGCLQGWTRCCAASMPTASTTRCWACAENW